jgi:hypothetical protein
MQDLGPNLTATVVTTGLLAFTTMGMRAFIRVTKRSWGIEDLVMSVACVCLARFLLGATSGMCSHRADTTPDFVHRHYHWLLLWHRCQR